MVIHKFKNLAKTASNAKIRPEMLERIRDRRLIKMVTHAYESTEFYRDILDTAGISPSDIRSVKDVVHLPVISRKEIQANYEAMISDRFAEKDVMIRTTSGSSGKMLRVLWETDNFWNRLSLYYRCLSMIGYTPFKKFLYFLPTPEETGFTFGLFRQMGLEPGTPFEEVRRHLLRFRPDIMAIYPSYAADLGNFLTPDEIRKIGIEAISLNSEMILPHDRAEIERTFNCPAYDEYSSVEMGFIASMCREKRMHVFTDNLVFEILDDRGMPCRPGQRGDIVLTSLSNYAMPFLRYRIGDIASFVEPETPCACGLSFPEIGPVEGRKDDAFILSDGTDIPAWKIYEIVERPLEDFGMDRMVISDFYLVQKARDLAHFYYVKGPDFQAGCLDRLRQGMDSLFGPPFSVQIRETDRIDRVKTVKRKYVHRELNA